MESFVVRTFNRGVLAGLVELTPEGNYRVLSHRGWKQEGQMFRKLQRRKKRVTAKEVRSSREVG